MTSNMPKTVIHMAEVTVDPVREDLGVSIVYCGMILEHIGREQENVSTSLLFLTRIPTRGSMLREIHHLQNWTTTAAATSSAGRESI